MNQHHRNNLVVEISVRFINNIVKLEKARITVSSEISLRHISKAFKIKAISTLDIEEYAPHRNFLPRGTFPHGIAINEGFDLGKMISLSGFGITSKARVISINLSRC